MLKNHLVVALRILRRHKGYALMNVAGLAAGMACCILIGLYVQDEMSYDRFSPHAERTVRLLTGNEARTPGMALPTLKAAHPDLIEAAARFWPIFAPAKMRHGDVVYVEEDIAFADAAALDVLGYTLREGDPAALRAPNAIVLSASTARKYFGDERALGQTLSFWGKDLEVTGVMEDVPAPAHYHPEALVSMPTLESTVGDVSGFPMYSYVVLPPGATAGQLDRALAALPAEQIGAEGLRTQPLSRIHFDTGVEGNPEPGGNPAYVSMLLLVAAFVLVLAGVNFVNLATARSLLRAREVGVRKALGAGRKQLVVQFLGESLVLAGAALGVALLVAELALPLFNMVTGKAVALGQGRLDLWIGGLTALWLVVGVGAGIYPALFLTRFAPSRAMRGAVPAGGAPVRRALVVTQFAVAVVLLVAVAVVYGQLRYMQGQDLGYEHEDVVVRAGDRYPRVMPALLGVAVVPAQRRYMLGLDLGYEHEDVLVLDGDRYPLVKQALLEVPGVLHVAGAPQAMGRPPAVGPAWVAGEDSARTVLYMPAAPDYVKTMGMRLVAGRGFSETRAAAAAEALILNEAAVRAFGWTDPIGQRIALGDGEGNGRREGRVVGVVEDFHYLSLHNPIEPLILIPSLDPNLTFVRLERRDPATLARVEAAWLTVNPDAPFNPYFLADRVQQAYEAERRLGWVFGGFTALAVVIAGLGLFGLAAFTTQQRTKEVGVRKVLGASVPSLVLLLSKDFLVLVLAAFAVAAPVAWLAMSRWLDGFTYHTVLGPGVFLGTGAAVLLLALATVGTQAFRSATADPVEALRSE